jgi:hypothetical protein
MLALYRDGSKLAGALAVNASRELLGYRKLLARGAQLQEALDLTEAASQVLN